MPVYSEGLTISKLNSTAITLNFAGVHPKDTKSCGGAHVDILTKVSDNEYHGSGPQVFRKVGGLPTACLKTHRLITG